MAKIAIIGVGGRTGTMFAFELKEKNDILSVGSEKEVKLIKNKKLYLKRGRNLELFQGNVILPNDFPNDFNPEIIFLTVKNPVGPAVKYYYQKIKDKNFPTLILSQNGLSAGEEALAVLKEIFGKDAEKIQIVRVSLFNPIEKEEVEENIYPVRNKAKIQKDRISNGVCINYFLPVHLAFGVFSGQKDVAKIKNIFQQSNIEAEEVKPEDVKNMEFSKLFTNLIGVPSALKSLSIEEGFKNKEIFQEEVLILKEYLKVVKRSGGRILNFKKMPLSLLANLIYFCPLSILSFFKGKLAKAISKGRGGKPKGNLDEVDYYNGEVVKLGEKLGVPTPFNKKVLEEIKK